MSRLCKLIVTQYELKSFNLSPQILTSHQCFKVSANYWKVISFWNYWLHFLNFIFLSLAPLHGFGFWFDVEFNGPIGTEANSDDAVVLSTAPEDSPTHWQQVSSHFSLFFLFFSFFHRIYQSHVFSIECIRICLHTTFLMNFIFSYRLGHSVIYYLVSWTWFNQRISVFFLEVRRSCIYSIQ